jgi:hypothetical protein
MQHAANRLCETAPDMSADTAPRAQEGRRLISSSTPDWKIAFAAVILAVPALYLGAHRVRLLRDIVQVIDALAHPAISRSLYPHPSLTPSAIVTAILAPLLFFHLLRLVLDNHVSAAGG